MPVGARRTRVLHGLAAKRGRVHRYTWIRWAVGIVFTAGIALLPLTGTLRLDLWGGRHMWLGEEVGLVEAAKAFAFPFLAVNVAIILVSRFLGRYLCGFVCPIGSLNRLAEWFAWRGRKGPGRWWGRGVVLAVCALLATITLAFWVDLRVFTDGSPEARLGAASFVLGITGVLFGTVQGLGMRFCRELCPSGVYFAVLGPESLTGVEFAHPAACTDCGACERVCPVDLVPRAANSGTSRPHGAGFYPDGLGDLALCLRCGDCVQACEDSTETGAEAAPTPLRLGFLKGEPETEETADADRQPV